MKLVAAFYVAFFCIFQYYMRIKFIIYMNDVALFQVKYFYTDPYSLFDFFISKRKTSFSAAIFQLLPDINKVRIDVGENISSLERGSLQYLATASVLLKAAYGT